MPVLSYGFFVAEAHAAEDWTCTVFSSDELMEFWLGLRAGAGRNVRWRADQCPEGVPIQEVVIMARYRDQSAFCLAGMW